MDMKALEEVLTPHERKCFVTLLNKGPMSVFELSKEAGIARAKLYEVCERLVRKGLLEVSVDNKKKLYVAKDPQNILSLVEERFRELESTRYKLAEIIPALQKVYSMKKSKEEVTIVKGEAAIINHLENISDSVKDVVVFAKAVAPTKYRGRWERWLNTMKSSGCNFRAIYEKSKDTQKAVKDAKKYDFEIRLVEKSAVGNVDWAVYDNKMFQIAIWETSTLIQVNSEDVAGVFSGIFEMIWNVSS